ADPLRLQSSSFGKWTNRDGADAAAGNSHIAVAARRPPALSASASRHVQEDHDLCPLTEPRYPEDLRCLEQDRIRLLSTPGCRDAEFAPGRRCHPDVAVGDRRRLWPKCACRNIPP